MGCSIRAIDYGDYDLSTPASILAVSGFEAHNNVIIRRISSLLDLLDNPCVICLTNSGYFEVRRFLVQVFGFFSEVK